MLPNRKFSIKVRKLVENIQIVITVIEFPSPKGQIIFKNDQNLINISKNFFFQYFKYIITIGQKQGKITQFFEIWSL